MTVNDYLSRRDATWMGQIYSFLGLSFCERRVFVIRARRDAPAIDAPKREREPESLNFRRDENSADSGEKFTELSYFSHFPSSFLVAYPIPSRRKHHTYNRMASDMAHLNLYRVHRRQRGHSIDRSFVIFSLFFSMRVCNRDMEGRILDGKSQSCL